MLPRKKCVELHGSLEYPLAIGYAALSRKPTAAAGLLQCGISLRCLLAQSILRLRIPIIS